MPEAIRTQIQRAYKRLIESQQNEILSKKPLITSNIIDFCKNIIHWTPYAYQEKLLLDNSKFIAARMARQSGKSTTVAVIALYTALSKSQAIVTIVAPSQRQARMMVQKVWRLANGIRHVFTRRPLKGRLDFRNGSIIQALPNSPETIRGLTNDLVLLDEWNFVKNDQELYDSVIFSLVSTNGRAIITSTPGSRDSIFYRMCRDKDGAFSEVSRHHVSYHDAIEPNGPIKQEILEQIKAQYGDDQNRWIREMEAEFSDDEDAMFPMNLIMSAVDPNLKMLPDDYFLQDSRNNNKNQSESIK